MPSQRVEFLRHLGARRLHGEHKPVAPLRRAALFAFSSRRRAALHLIQSRRAHPAQPSSASCGASRAKRVHHRRIAHRVRVPFGTPFKGPQTLSEMAHWAGRFVAQVDIADTKAIGEAVQTMNWVMTSSFSGSGSAEIAAHCLLKAIRESIGPEASQPRIAMRRVCDIAPHTHPVLSHVLQEDACVLTDIMDWPQSLRGVDLHQRVAPTLEFKEKVKCLKHGHCILVPTTHRGPKARALHIEIGGPPCPPWSRMGKRRRESDRRHAPHQVWIAYLRKRRPHVIVIEEVDSYDPEIIAENFPSAEWDVRVCILDPRIFGIPMARRRIYAIVTLRDATYWNTTLPLHKLMQKLTSQRVASADVFWDEADIAAFREPTASEKTHHAEYETFPLHHRLAHAAVWDLAQGGQRPRGSCVDGALPTLTTHCGSMYHRKKQMFLSPHMLMRVMGHISDPHCAGAAGLPCMRDIGDHCSNAQMLQMAGNAMHAPCIGACLLIVALHVRLR